MGGCMSVSVIGERIKLLDLSMIRRYNSPTPIVDPAVARILVNKGFAIYLDKKIEKIEKKVEIVIPVIEEDSIKLFPKEIIRE
jgi:hypothetical protein